jgi:hypothetical protein
MGGITRFRCEFPSRAQKPVPLTIPNNSLSTQHLKQVWPDLSWNHTSSFNCGKQHAKTIICILDALKIGKTARIIDIGAHDNALIEEIRKVGFINSFGIDSKPIILGSKYGFQANFRDVPFDEKFHLIHFGALLDYFRGGNFNFNGSPTLELFAWKLGLHLVPNGFLIFHDFAENYDAFCRELKRNGFEFICELLPPSDNIHHYAIWRKAN